MLKSMYLRWFSKPKGERALYRAIRQSRPRRIVEMGVAMGRRTERLLSLAGTYHPVAELDYTGIDLFEARPSTHSGMTLKRAYREINAICGRVNLLPGDPFLVLTRYANVLTKTDLLIIAADQDAASLAQAWFYVPRMLHAHSWVLIEEPVDASMSTHFRRLTLLEIEQLARKAKPPRRAVAA